MLQYQYLLRRPQRPPATLLKVAIQTENLVLFIFTSRSFVAINLNKVARHFLIILFKVITMKPVKITFEKLPEALSHLIEEVADLKKIVTTQPKQSTQKEEEYLTPAEMMQCLKISSVTLWHWDKKGITRPLRVGNIKRYRKSDLEKIIVEYGKNCG